MLHQEDRVIPMADQDGRLTTREKILLEASRLFAIKGYHGTSTREIAAAVEIQQPSLFHHFPSKHAIMAELIDIDHEEAAAAAEREAADPGSPALRLYRYLVSDIAYICSCAYDLSSVEAVMGDPEFAKESKRHDKLLAARRKIIEEGIAAGEFVDFDPGLPQRVIGWILRGDIVDTAGESVADPVRTAQDLAAFVLRAMLADPAQLEAIQGAAGEGS
jgi:AcrR family transcriptional regulator